VCLPSERENAIEYYNRNHVNIAHLMFVFLRMISD